MRKILEIPAIYNLYQELGGFNDARRTALSQYVDMPKVRRMFDIGCGPGHTVNYIPKGVQYIGFDTDQRYIDYANKHFGSRGKFFARHFDDSAAEEFGKPDLILMNGVIHHLDDAMAEKVLKSAKMALSSDGTFYALDPCLEDGQHPIARRLILGDRGEHIRTKEGYEMLIRSAFPYSDVVVRDDISRLPYTFSITRGWLAARQE